MSSSSTSYDSANTTTHRHHQSSSTFPSSFSLHSSTTSSPWLKKPLHIVLQQEHEAGILEIDHGSNHDYHDGDKSTSGSHNATSAPRGGIRRHLTLFDLVSVGVGGTIGSGIFVLSGYIAHHYAGPATCLSFIIAGVCASCNGVCYAELAGRIPAAGSTYVYAYVAMGELPAVIAAACLTLEYAISGAAVARSWGDKVTTWCVDYLHWTSAEVILNPGWGINPMAFVVSALSVVLLLDGVQESKRVTNFFTMFKVALVVFMIVGGFCLFDRTNITPFFVPSLGATGIWRGATSSFFGYLGYDEVCCIASEALHPERDMPRAVLWTLGIVTSLYVCAAIALVGMQPWTTMSDTSAFPDSFHYNGIEWAAQLVAFGEVFCLPVVVLISLMAQPRLQLALAKDGLLPELFGRIDAHGNLHEGAKVSGIVMTLIATFVPFGYLDDLISSGILIAFSMTNCCVVILRCESPFGQPTEYLHHCLVAYNALCFLSALTLRHLWNPSENNIIGPAITLICCTGTFWLAMHIGKFPHSAIFGITGATTITQPQPTSNHHHHHSTTTTYFKTPLVPHLPLAGMFVNWYLIAQLEVVGLMLMLLYIGLAVLFYFCYGAKRSVGNATGWNVPRHDHDYTDNNDNDYNDNDDSNSEHYFDNASLLRSISLPRTQYQNVSITATSTTYASPKHGEGET